MKTPTPTVLPLASAEVSLEEVGGKGNSLAAMAAAGLPVPDGFLVTTRAYRDFVDANALQSSILEIAAEADARPESLDRASARIRALFENAPLEDDLAASVRDAYSALSDDGPAVAVRSSATAEDLPDSSFAGQQDTYLNVRGSADLLGAIRRCWASLWTARAIGYRARMGIDNDAVAMGVVVQRMVEAEVSGILFTANPTTGARSELVVNASFGLGEAIVGGEVTPDTFVLDRSSRGVKETVIGAKETKTVSFGSQGTVTEPVPDAERRAASLSSERLADLAAMSMDAERLMDGVPQDIEWAVADDACWLLQSRPITHLPPAPLEDVRWDPPGEGAKLIRRQIVENMPDPLSPLFAELYLTDGLDQSMDRFLEDLGAPIRIDDFIERPFFLTVNGFAYCRADYHIPWRVLWILPRILYWYATALSKLLRTVIPRWRSEGLPAYLATIAEWRRVDPATATETQLLYSIRALALADARYWFHVAVVMGVAKITDGLLNAFLTSRLVPGNLTSGVFLRGFPSKTLEAHRDLEAIAQRVHAEPAIRDLIIATPPDGLLDALSRQSAGDAVRADIQRYLDTYGHTIYTLDFAQPTQGEDPLPVLLGLKALVADGDYDMVARQAAMVRAREQQEQATSASLGRTRRWLFRKLLRWAQEYGPHREDALFYIGAAWPTLRRLALELGRRLVGAGSLSAPDDVFYLDTAALETACTARAEGRAHTELAHQAARQRELREARMGLHPPGMVPEKSRWKFGPIDMTTWETQKRNPLDADTLDGSAVSPGKVTGPASVILSPVDFADMQPNTILVCPTTTPAWTPLFTLATGLVTDIGGILAHGSIVAREYGIPAVMGTGNVTKRIVSGQQITVDGDAGTVTIRD